MRSRKVKAKTLVNALLCAALVGCSSMETDSRSGRTVGGDGVGVPASIEITPVNDVNPVQTQHVLVASVRDSAGNLVPNARVEWMLGNGGVGDIVAISGLSSGGGRQVVERESHRGHDRPQYWSHGDDPREATHTPTPVLKKAPTTGLAKVNNSYAVNFTRRQARVLDMGTADAADDILIEPGQAWISITSAVEGTSNIIAYCPDIADWNEHKAFATKKWMDVSWSVTPEEATNRVGDPHPITTKVWRHSDNSPLEGYIVNYTITDGGPATLAPGNSRSVSVRTNAQGIAVATLSEAQAIAQSNSVQVDIVRPANDDCCIPAEFISSVMVSKTWKAPSIDIVKTGPETAIVGETFAYTIKASNSSDIEVRNAVVTDSLPAQLEYVSSSPSAQVAGQMLTWQVGNMAAGASRDMTVRVRARSTGRVTNCAEVRANDNLSDRDCADTVITAPALQLEKSATTEGCDIIKTTFTVRNTGSAPATDVVIRDPLPRGLTTVDGRSEVVVNVGTVAAGQTRRFAVDLKAAGPGEYTNQATVTAAGGLSAQSQQVRSVIRTPRLAIEKTCPETRFIGRPVTYQITVRNTGDAPATNVDIVDQLPGGATFVSASDGGQHAGGQVSWRIASIQPNGSRTVSVTARAAGAGQLRNTVTANAACAEQVSAECVTMVEGIPALLLEVIDVDDPIEVGAQETYVITVTNQGTANARNIVIEATIPAEMRHIRSTGQTQATAQGNVIRFAPVAELAPKAVLTFRVVTEAVSEGDVRFQVSMTSASLTTPVSETESTRLY